MVYKDLVTLMVIVMVKSFHTTLQPKDFTVLTPVLSFTVGFYLELK